MSLRYKNVQIVDLWRYTPEFNADGTEKHEVCSGARFHVLSYSSKGVRCSEPNCEINKVAIKEAQS